MASKHTNNGILKESGLHSQSKSQSYPPEIFILISFVSSIFLIASSRLTSSGLSSALIEQFVEEFLLLEKVPFPSFCFTKAAQGTNFVKGIIALLVVRYQCSSRI